MGNYENSFNMLSFVFRHHAYIGGGLLLVVQTVLEYVAASVASK